MEEIILRLNKKRLSCLLYLALASVPASAAAVFLFFALSPAVRLGFYGPFFTSVALGATAFYFFRLYGKKRLEYNADYTGNAFAIASMTAFPEGKYSKSPPAGSDFEDIGAFMPVSRALFKEYLAANHEGMEFDTAFARIDGIFEGRIFRFAFGAPFRKTLLARQRGFSPEIKASDCTLGGLAYETHPGGKTAKDRIFAVLSPSDDDAMDYFNDLVRPLLFNLRENLPQNIKITVGFHREKLYVLLAAPETLSFAPLFVKVKKESVKKDAAGELMAVLSFALYLSAEKNLWKKRIPPPAPEKI